MWRPKRSKKRFTGEADATEAVGTLSAINETVTSSHDGRKMRRRMALGAAACLLVLGLIIGLTVGKKDKDDSFGSGSKSVDTVDLGHYEIPKSPVSGFELLTSQTIEGQQAAVAHFKHTKSGMQVLTMIPKDPNQDATFGINFRTPPENEAGVQFVVQNSILSGSKNYPVKNPFDQVERGSLQTYWSTWNNRDRTSFVFASRNLADFTNNLKVMVDAVFHPLFVNSDYKWIYRQEAWRLEQHGNKNLKING